jgi:hypothetical protein
MPTSPSKSGQLIDFPALNPADMVPPRRVALAAARRRYRLRDIAHLLAFDGLDRRTQISQLRQLARLDRMPLPINPRIWHEQVLRDHRAICAASLWDAAVFDAWQHHPTAPNGEAGESYPPAPIDLRQRMRQRALTLEQGGRA